MQNLNRFRYLMQFSFSSKSSQKKRYIFYKIKSLRNKKNYMKFNYKNLKNYKAIMIN